MISSTHVTNAFESEEEKSPEAIEKKKQLESARFSRVTWITARMAKPVDKELYFETNARETIFYIFLVISVTISALGLIQPIGYFLSQNFRAKMLKAISYSDAENANSVQFNDIMTVDEMWEYLEKHLIVNMYPESFESAKEQDIGIGKENVLVGIPILRQVMVSPAECSPPFPRAFFRVDDATDSEQRRQCWPAFEAGVTEALDPPDDRFGWQPVDAAATRAEAWTGRAAAYPARGFRQVLGRSGSESARVLRAAKEGGFVGAGTRAVFLDFGYYNAHVNLFTAARVIFEQRQCWPAFETGVTEALDPPDDRFGWQPVDAAATHAEAWTGRAAAYPARGFRQVLGRSGSESARVLAAAKKQGFFGAGTRAVFLDFGYYNAHVNLFTAAIVIFEIPPSGRVLPTALFYSTRLPRYGSWLDFLYLSFEIIFAILILFYIAQAIREILFLNWGFFREFWSYVDVAIILTSLALWYLSIAHAIRARRVLADLSDELEDYTSLQYVFESDASVRNCTAVIVFLVYSKIVKYLHFGREMEEIHTAFVRGLSDIFALILFMLIAFIGFAFFGVLAFGSQLWDFCTFNLSFFALFRILLGDLQYHEVEKADPILAPIFYVLFLAIVFAILMNIMFAIIYDCYGDVKTETAISPRSMYMIDFYKKVCYNLLKLCGCHVYIPRRFLSTRKPKVVDDVRAILKNCGFSDLDIDMFLDRYNIDPTAKVRNQDVDKIMEDLKHELPPKREGLSLSDPPPMPGFVVEPERPDQQSQHGSESTRRPTVTSTDFRRQDERLEVVETVVASIVGKLDFLLRRLNALDLDRKKLPFD